MFSTIIDKINNNNYLEAVDEFNQLVKSIPAPTPEILDILNQLIDHLDSTKPDFNNCYYGLKICILLNNINRSNIFKDDIHIINTIITKFADKLITLIKSTDIRTLTNDKARILSNLNNSNSNTSPSDMSSDEFKSILLDRRLQLTNEIITFKDEVLKILEKNIAIETDTLILPYYYLVCVMGSLKLTPDPDEQFIELFDAYRQLLIKIVESEGQLHLRQVDNVYETLESMPLIKLFVLQLFRASLVYLFEVSGIFIKLNEITFDMDLELQNALNTFKKQSMISAFPESKDKKNIKILDNKTDILDYILPANLAFMELVCASPQFEPQTFESLSNSDSFTVENIPTESLPIENLKSIIDRLFMTAETAIDNLVIHCSLKYELQPADLMNADKSKSLQIASKDGYLNDTGLEIFSQLSKAMMPTDAKKTNNFVTKTFNPNSPTERIKGVPITHLLKRLEKKIPIANDSAFKYLTLIPYLVISYNTRKNNNNEMIEKFNDLLFKFALLSNAQYDEKLRNTNNNSKVDFDEFVLEHKNKIKPLLKKLRIVYGLFENNTAHPKQIESELNSLDNMIEAIYQEMGYVHKGMLDFLEKFTKHQVKIRNTAKDLIIDFQEPLHCQVFADQLKKQGMLSQTNIEFTVNDNQIVIPHFRSLQFLRTYDFCKGFTTDLKKLNKEKQEATTDFSTYTTSNIPSAIFKNDGPAVTADDSLAREEKIEDEVTVVRIKKGKSNEDRKKEILEKIERNRQERENTKVQKQKLQKAQDSKRSNSSTNNNNNQFVIGPSTQPEEAVNASTAEETEQQKQLPPTIEVVNYSNDIEPEQKFIKSDKPVLKDLIIPLQYQMRLDSAYDELTREREPDEPKPEDSFILRYFVLYNGIRMLQAILSIAKDLNIKHDNELFIKILSFRNMLADRMDYFLDPNGADMRFLSTDAHSVFAMFDTIYHRVECIVTYETPTPINLKSNDIYKALCPDGVNVINPPSSTAKNLLTSIHDKLSNRLGLVLSSKIIDANELDANPFNLGAVKMLLSEIGGLARRLRIDHGAICKHQELLGTNLKFESYPDKLIDAISDNTNTDRKNNSNKKKDSKNPKRLLPYLSTCNSIETDAFLSGLSIGQLLMLCIEIRNLIAHDIEKEATDFPEEITTHLAFDIGKHLLRRCPEIVKVLENLTDDDRIQKKPLPTLNPNAAIFVPKFTLTTSLQPTAAPFIPRSTLPMRNNTHILFNTNNNATSNQIPDIDNSKPEKNHKEQP